VYALHTEEDDFYASLYKDAGLEMKRSLASSEGEHQTTLY